MEHVSVCLNCNSQIIDNKPRKFCGQKCVYTFNEEKKQKQKLANSVEIVCQQCDKPFLKFKSKSGDKFCSKECFKASYSVPEDLIPMLIKEYQDDKMSMRAIGKNHGFSDVTVRKVLQDNNIVLRSHKVTMQLSTGINFSDESTEKIIKMYNEHFSIEHISKEIGIGYLSVRKYLKQNNILKQRSHVKVLSKGNVTTRNFYDYNSAAFTAPASSATAYWVGFLLADGYVYTKRQRLSVELGKKDCKHLEKFASFLEIKTPYPIYNVKSKNTVRFNLSCSDLLKQLENYNVIANKSLVAQAPNSLLNNSHFWRGLIDGDGSILNNGSTRAVSLCSASEKLILQFNYWVGSNIGVEPSFSMRLRENRTTPLYTSYIGGVRAYKLLEILYKDVSADICLSRKRERALYIINNYEIKGKKLLKQG